MSFSPIGDSLALARAFKEVVIVVQEYVDAKEDYQRTVANLETIDAILACFENFRTASDDRSFINAIQAQAQSAATEVPEQEKLSRAIASP